MNVKELEQITGLSRANIRFYEKQGLLSPARKDNNYRDYDLSDVELLKKIVIMRKLGISIDDIAALQKGEKRLCEVINGNIEILESEKKRIEGALEVSKTIFASGADYDSIDADGILARMEEIERGGGGFSRIERDRRTNSDYRLIYFVTAAIVVFICLSIWLFIPKDVYYSDMFDDAVVTERDGITEFAFCLTSGGKIGFNGGISREVLTDPENNVEYRYYDISVTASRFYICFDKSLLHDKYFKLDGDYREYRGKGSALGGDGSGLPCILRVFYRDPDGHRTLIWEHPDADSITERIGDFEYK